MADCTWKTTPHKIEPYAMTEHAVPLSDANQSALLIIDVQERLAAAMTPELREQVVRNASILLAAARALQVPIFLTEQYPKGLGRTVEALTEAAGDAGARFEKTCFSCSDARDLMDALRASGRRQVVIAGMEAHVCVLQSALSLRQEGFAVYVAVDAIASRAAANLQNAIDRIQKAGVIATNTESVIFEWLRDSRHEHFRAISTLVR
jgi:nicotinamidase-related amidase